MYNDKISSNLKWSVSKHLCSSSSRVQYELYRSGISLLSVFSWGVELNVAWMWARLLIIIFFLWQESVLLHHNWWPVPGITGVADRIRVLTVPRISATTAHPNRTTLLLLTKTRRRILRTTSVAPWTAAASLYQTKSAAPALVTPAAVFPRTTGIRTVLVILSTTIKLIPL